HSAKCHSSAFPFPKYVILSNQLTKRNFQPTFRKNCNNPLPVTTQLSVNTQSLQSYASPLVARRSASSANPTPRKLRKVCIVPSATPQKAPAEPSTNSQFPCV